MDNNTKFVRNDIWLVVVILFEFLLFRSFVLREICNIIPSDVDQSVYLNESYKIYLDIIATDYKSVLGRMFSTSNTGLPILGAVMLFLFGDSRLSMLVPNFIGFMVLQIVGYKSVNRIFGNGFMGWSFIGIMLLSNTTFGWAANFTSFRADFLFACVFSTWIILLVEAVRTKDDKKYFVSSIVAGLMLFIRFFSICFLVPIMIGEIVLFFLVFKEKKRTLVRLFKYAAGTIVGGGWFFLANAFNFIRYYLGAMTSDMKDIWQIQLSIIENLIYYPRYFFEFHMGYDLTIFLLIICFLCVVISAIKKIKARKTEKRAGIIVMLAFIVPYLFLLISNKQPLVISIWNGIFIYTVFLLMGRVNTICKPRVTRLGLLIFSVIVCVMGGLEYVANTSSGFYGAYVSASSKDEAWRINEIIADWAIENRKDKVNIVLDRYNDVISLDSLELCTVETEDRWIDYKYAIESMNGNFATLQFDIHELDAGLINSDIIIVARSGYNYESTFPTDQLLDSYRDEIYAYATENFELLGEFDWQNNDLQVYVKRNVVIDSEWPDWLSVQSEMSFCKQEGDQFLVVEGNYMEGVYPELIVAAMDVENQQMLETTAEVENGRYRISVNISEMSNDEVTIELDFQSFFVPSEISDSPDNRKLAVIYPDNCTIK